LRAFNCFVDIWNHAVAPAAQLVPEDGEDAAEPLPADRTHADHPTLITPSAGGRLLDYVPTLRHNNFQARVIEIARGATLDSRRDCLVDASIQAYEVPTRAKRKPVQIYPDSIN
jgi:hypothetical protein